MNVYLLGAKNPETARQVAAQRLSNPDFEVVGFLDNDPSKKGSTFLGYPVLGGVEMVEELLRKDGHARFVNLITGSTIARYEVTAAVVAAGGVLTNLIHPSVNLDDVEIGVGNYIQEGVIIQAGAKIGNNSSIHVCAIVAHEDTVGHSVFIAQAASVAGEVAVNDGAFIGTNATILPRLTVGRWTTVGAAAVVSRDVPDYVTVAGSPARRVRESEVLYGCGDPLESRR